MDSRRGRTARMMLTGTLGAVVFRMLRRRGDDLAHAPGKRHRGAPPEVAGPHAAQSRKAHDQPWVRRSHSDSQQRRFRR